MKRLYMPAKIGCLEVSNRIIMGPMGLSYTQDGTANERVIEFFRQRAKGQPGVIVVGGTQVDPKRIDHMTGLHCFSDENIPSIKRLVDMVHHESEGKTKLFLQFMHQGRYAKKKILGGAEAVGPSPVPSPYTGFEVPHELTVDEIHELVGFYRNAARIAKASGVDGIEICTNSGYLFGQFFSPLTNKRTDEYGGDFSGRTKFYFEVVDAIREEVGPEYVVTTRLGGSDLIPGSNTLDDACQIAKAISDCGKIDAISVTGGWHESSVPQVTMEIPFDTLSYLGRTIKKHVSIPVAMSNRLGIDYAEKYVELGALDFAVFSRGFLADPQIVAKGREGRKDDIRTCIGCNQRCLDNLLTSKGLVSCLANVSCGHECEVVNKEGLMPEQVKSEHPEKMLVIGAGPAGLEFARVSASRGHQVTVWERGQSYGGQVNFAAAPPRRSNLLVFLKYLENTCIKLGVNIEYGHEASAEEIEAACKNGIFDRVVLATGSQPIVPKFPTEEGADVVVAQDYLIGKADTGRRVVVIGGGAVGVETSIKLAEEGTISAESLRSLMIYNADTPERLKSLLNEGVKSVTIVEMMKSIGSDIGPGTRFSMMARLKQLGVKQYKLTKAMEIKKDEVILQSEDGNTFSVPADTVVMAIGSRPRTDLEQALAGKVEKLHSIGDCVKTAKIMDAVDAAYWLAITL